MKGKIEAKKINSRVLKVLLYVLVVILISLISFGGVYTKKTYKMTNILPQYLLGTDLYGYRNVVIKVKDEEKTDDENKEIKEAEENTDVENEEEAEPEKEEEETSSNLDNYKKVKKIIKARLKALDINYYEIRLNEADGTIYVEIPENSDSDLIAEYCETKGEFKITDNETGEVLLDNTSLKKATTQYASTSTGTAIYLLIEFNKEGTEKLKEISATYIKSTDDEGKDTSKKVKVAIDKTTILTSSFAEEITDGKMQLTIGTSTDNQTLKKYITQGNNTALFLNSEPMPIEYELQINRFVYSEISENTIYKIIMISAIIYIILLAYMIIKYKKQGILSALACIGFLAILLIIIRCANVTITLTGIYTIIFAALIEYFSIRRILSITVKEELNQEEKLKEIKNTKIGLMQNLIPLLVIAVVFTMAKWQPIFSIGMILFWGTIVALIWNWIALKVSLQSKENK